MTFVWKPAVRSWRTPQADERRAYRRLTRLSALPEPATFVDFRGIRRGRMYRPQRRDGNLLHHPSGIIGRRAPKISGRCLRSTGLCWYVSAANISVRF